VARAMVLALAQAQPGRRVIESAELLEMGQ
jgi:hypothetical protein